MDILTPQRFYQIDFNMRNNENVNIVIDLKHVIEISLHEGAGRKDIGIHRISSPMALLPVSESKVASEEFAKIVTAWTTYKLATER